MAVKTTWKPYILAFANIKKAAEHYGLNVEEDNWHQLGKKPHTPNPAH